MTWRGSPGREAVPPEHDHDRERQLAALRRYVSDLDIRQMVAKFREAA